MTRPLSGHAIAKLASLIRVDVPTLQVNPGVVWKLTHEGLAEVVMLPSPYASHKGQPIQHLRITAAGRDRLKAAE